MAGAIARLRATRSPRPFGVHQTAEVRFARPGEREPDQCAVPQRVVRHAYLPVVDARKRDLGSDVSGRIEGPPADDSAECDEPQAVRAAKAASATERTTSLLTMATLVVSDGVAVGWASVLSPEGV